MSKYQNRKFFFILTDKQEVIFPNW